MTRRLVVVRYRRRPRLDDAKGRARRGCGAAMRCLHLPSQLLLLLLQQEVPDGGPRVAAAAELGPAKDVAGWGLLAGRVGVAPPLAALGEVVEVLAAELLGHAVVGCAVVARRGGGRGGGR